MFFHNKKKQPQFFILGTQKGGTTSLYNLLTKHPSILPAKRKEIHYFEREYHQGKDWYLDFFPNEYFFNKNKITGEATPYYLYDERVPERMLENFPKAKFIVLLRNPITRAYSHYNMQKKRGTEVLNFEEALLKESERLQYFRSLITTKPEEALFGIKEHSYKDRGKYSKQLERWFQYFPREQFYIQQSELFFEQTNKVVNEIFTFLGIKEFNLGSDIPISFQGNYSDMNNETYQHLQDYFSPYNEQLFTLLNTCYEW